MSTSAKSVPFSKSRKTPASLRKAQILALQTMGMSQSEIAQKLGVSRRTIVQDLQDLKPAKEQVASLLTDLQTELAILQTPRRIAENYVELAERAKNEAVRVGAQSQILDIRGVVTEKERIRAKQGEQSAPQPMFVLPPGCNLALTINQQNNTISRDAAGLHNTPNVTRDNSTTIGRSSQSDADIDHSGGDIVHE